MWLAEPSEKKCRRFPHPRSRGRMLASRLAERCDCWLLSLAPVAQSVPQSMACVAVLVRALRPTLHGSYRVSDRADAMSQACRYCVCHTSQREGMNKVVSWMLSYPNVECGLGRRAWIAVATNCVVAARDVSVGERAISQRQWATCRHRRVGKIKTCAGCDRDECPSVDKQFQIAHAAVGSSAARLQI